MFFWQDIFQEYVSKAGRYSEGCYYSIPQGGLHMTSLVETHIVDPKAVDWFPNAFVSVYLVVSNILPNREVIAIGR